MFLNLIDSALVAGGDDGHAGNIMALRLAYGQTVDVEASSREKTGYLGENTVFIFYKYKIPFILRSPYFVLLWLSTSQTMMQALSQARKRSSSASRVSLLSQWK